MSTLPTNAVATAESVVAFLAWADARPPVLYQLGYTPGLLVSITIVCNTRPEADAVVADIPWEDRDSEFSVNGGDGSLFVLYGRAWNSYLSVISRERAS